MSTADRIDVRIVGDSTQVAGAADIAKNAIGTAVDSMRSKFQDLGLVSKTAMGVVGESATAAAERVSASAEVIAVAHERIKASYEKLTGVVEAFNAVIVGATALLAAGFGMGEAISATNKLTAENLKLSKQLGISLEAASGLHAALSKLGIQSDAVANLATKLSRQLKTNEERINALGVATRDSGGHFLDLEQILINGTTALGGYKEGADRNIAAQILFGRAAGDTTQLIRLNREALEEGAETAKKLGLVTTQDGVNAMRAYKESLQEAKEVFEAVFVLIGNAVLPVLTRMGQWLSENGEQAIAGFKAGLSVLGDVFSVVATVVRVFWDVCVTAFEAIMSIIRATFNSTESDGKIWQAFIRGTQLAIEGFGFAVNFWMEVISEAIKDVISFVHNLSDVIIALATLDFSAASAAYHRFFEDIAKNSKDAADHIIADARRTQERFTEILHPTSPAKKPPTPEQKFATGTVPDSVLGGKKDRKKKDPAEKSDMGVYEEQLARLKLSLDQQNLANGTFHEMSKEDEAKFWQSILATDDLGAKDRQAISKKYLDLELADHKERFQAGIAQLQAEMDAAKENGDRRVDLARQVAARVTAAYGAGSKEAIAAERALTRVIEEEAAKQAKAAEDAIVQREKGELAVVAAAEAVAKHRVDMGLATDAELIQQQLKFEAQRHAIQERALADEIAIAARSPNSVERTRALNDQRLEMERKYQTTITQLQNQAQLQRTQVQRQAVTATASLWSQNISSLLTLQQGFAATVGNIYRGMVGILANALGSFIQDWITKKLSALILDRTTTTATNVAQILSYASVASAAAFASTAAIPIVGPGLAPAAAAASYAAVAAMAPAASAAGGYDIPAGINPVVQTHAREMILPEQYADVIRAMADGDGGGAGSGGGGNHFSISALDARGVARLLMDNRGAVADALRSHTRGNGR